ncbi:hypothetical protein U9M48_011136 [Paspalum notatum var. saurae]|uniref:Uncharacterized protein n=1 Tax=Paspalum notatum var. saurae TaxID=547442 RepID=A0AAQ3WH68_PASNO
MLGALHVPSGLNTYCHVISLKRTIISYSSQVSLKGELPDSSLSVVSVIWQELTGDCWHLLGDTFAGLPGSATLAVQQPGTLADRLSSRLHDCVSRW